MRAVLDDQVERPVGGGELREMLQVGLIGQLDLDALGLELLAVRLDVDADDLGAAENTRAQVFSEAP